MDNKFGNKISRIAKRTVVTVLLFLASPLMYISVKAAPSALDPAPMLFQLTTLFMNALTVLWAFFILDALFYLVRYGAKFIFVWAGAMDPNTDIAKDAKDKLGRFLISFLGVFLIPLIISIVLRFIAPLSPTGCYSFINHYWMPVFEIFFSQACL